MQQNSDLDYLEILPASTDALRAEMQTLLEHSASYSAAIASLDRKTGTYKIILQGKLRAPQRMRSAAA